MGVFSAKVQKVLCVLKVESKGAGWANSISNIYAGYWSSRPVPDLGLPFLLTVKQSFSNPNKGFLLHDPN